MPVRTRGFHSQSPTCHLDETEGERTASPKRVKVLVICRPRPGVGRDQIAEHAAAEVAALKRLKAEGQLLEAYSPGGPGAILLLDDEPAIAERLLRSLPLVRAELIDTEVIELHPFAGLTTD
jgi:hypothetical protein